MKLVVDTNKIIACLLKDGRVRWLFFSEFLELYAPYYTLEEIDEHKHRILKKVSKDSYDFIMSKVKLKLNMAKITEEDAEIVESAKELAEKFDIDDWPFIALALKLNTPIWTNDKDMIVYGLKFGKYLALDTKSVEDLLKGRSLNDVREDLKRRYL